MWICGKLLGWYLVCPLIHLGAGGGGTIFKKDDIQFDEKTAKCIAPLSLFVSQKTKFFSPS